MSLLRRKSRDSYHRHRRLDPHRHIRRLHRDVAQPVPVPAIREIGVHDDEIAVRVTETLAGTDHQPDVAVRRNWYY